MTKPVDTLREALYECGLVQPLSVTSKGGSISVMCRQVPGQEKAWISVIDQLLSTDVGNCDLHVCRKYVKKEGRLLFGWFIGLSAPTVKVVAKSVDALAPVLKAASSLVVEEVSTPAKTTAPTGKSPMASNFDFKKWTDASPRASEYSGPDPVAPAKSTFSLKTVSHGIQEMPLPHVYSKDMNKPAAGSNRGAAIAGSSELFKGLNVRK